ncbi:hypothetical protein MKX01_039926 [Papaver californicum]|nr:hypothetical protein MKX01_039926 [Papaver californicum]
MDFFTSFRASAKYTNLVVDDTFYFGIMQKIVDLDYGDFTEVVFLCDWVRVEDKTTGSYVDVETNLRFVNLEKFISSSKDIDEPFIHVSQDTKIFYCADETRKHWHLILESPNRSGLSMISYEYLYVFTASTNQAPLVSTSETS